MATLWFHMNGNDIYTYFEFTKEEIRMIEGNSDKDEYISLDD